MSGKNIYYIYIYILSDATTISNMTDYMYTDKEKKQRERERFMKTKIQSNFQAPSSNYFKTK